MSVKKIQLIFVLLQFGDVVTTLSALRIGGFEQNTLVSHLMVVGPVQGLLLSKMIILAVAGAAAIGRRYRALRWGNIVWPKGEPDKAQYRCDHKLCGQLIGEHQKAWMLARGERRAGNRHQHSGQAPPATGARQTTTGPAHIQTRCRHVRGSRRRVVEPGQPAVAGAPVGSRFLGGDPQRCGVPAITVRSTRR